MGALIEVGKLADAERACAAGLAAARKAGAPYDQSYCLQLLAQLDLRRRAACPGPGRICGRRPRSPRWLGGNLLLLPARLNLRGHLCAQTQRPADAVTAWAASAACEQRSGLPSLPHEVRVVQEPLQKAREGTATRRARGLVRGAAMTLAAAAEYAALLVAEDAQAAARLSWPAAAQR